MNALRNLSLLGINLVLVTAACAGDDPVAPTGAGGGDVSSSSGDTTTTSSGMGGDASTTSGSTMVTSSSTGGAGGTGGGDTTSPTVVSVMPADGATGIEDDEVIVITFSEAMDKPSAQAAFQSSNLGPVTFNWSDDTTLEITPAGLAYAQGGPSVMANVYDYTLTTVATDLAGNGLDANRASSFSTLREITDHMPETQEVSVKANGTYCSDIVVGIVVENNLSTDCRLLVSYDLASIPAAAQLQSANLSCDYAYYVGPKPAGQTRLEHVAFDPTNLAAGWSASSLETYNDPFSFASFITTNPFDIDPVNAMINELGGQTPTSVQFRLTVVSQSLETQDNHLVWRNPQSPNTGCDNNDALEVTYLVP